MTDQVSNIGVRLTLEDNFTAPLKEATASLGTFQKQAKQAASGAGQMKAGGGVTAASGPSSGQSLNGVNVSLTVNQASLAALRAQIIKGLGTIPITVSAKIAQGQAKAVMAGMITESVGTRAGAAHEVESTVKRNLPQRAAGGPVEARRPVVVGERRPEVFVPHAAGRIEHDLAAYRRREAELASLEYQIQKRRARLERERMLDLEEAKLAGSVNIHGTVGEGPWHYQRGGRVRSPRRQQAWNITRAHGNIRNWEHAMWRDEESRFLEERRREASREEAMAEELWNLRAGRVRGGGVRARQGGGPASRGGWGTIDPISEDWLYEQRRKGGWRKPDWYEALDPKWLTKTRGTPEEGGGPIHRYTQPMDPWMYHVTNIENIESILEQGVQPQSFGYNRYGSLNNNKKRTYWSRYPNPVWAHGDPVVLAARLSDIKPRQIDEIGELMSPKGVAPEKLRFLAADKRLHPLRRMGGPAYASGGRTVWSSEDPPQTLTFEVNGVNTPFYGTQAEIMEEIRLLASQGAEIRPPRRVFEPVGPTDIHSSARSFVRRPKRQKGGHVEHVSVASLIPYRQQDRESFPRYGRDFSYLDELTETIRAEGMKQPVEVWYDPTTHRATLGDGNHRLAVAQRLGMEKVPAYVFVPKGGRLRGAHNLPGEPVNLPWGGFYPPSKIGLRRRGGPAHAGFGARAYRATIANEGGTFPLSGGPQPTRGYAVGIPGEEFVEFEGGFHTAAIAAANDPRDFIRKFNRQRKLQEAAGGYPPYIGTWVHEGQIHIDPVAVMMRRLEADMVARAKHQESIYDLRKTVKNPEIPTSSRKLRAQADRINALIMKASRRQGGGDVFGPSGKPSTLAHRHSLVGVPGFAIGPEASWEIDVIRALESRERFLALDPVFNAGNVIGEHRGTAGSATPSLARPRRGIPAESLARWRSLGYSSALQNRMGTISVHNHPFWKGLRDIWRPSGPDVVEMFGSGAAESWVVTPQSTAIMRPHPRKVGRNVDLESLYIATADALAEATNTPASRYLKGTNFYRPTEAFYRVINSPGILGNAEAQKAMFDRLGEELGFDWELWKHSGPTPFERPVKTPRARKITPFPGQLSFDLQRRGYGGPAHALTGRQQAIAAERAKIFDQVIAAIRDVAGTVSPALLKGGARDWYTIAHAQALGDLADFGKLGLGDIGLGAFAAAAPGQSWDANRAILRRILRTGRYPRGAQFTEQVPGYSPVKASANYGYSNWEKARLIIARQSLVGPHGEPLLKGPKVEPFYGNLSGKDVHSLTLDARMSRITGIPKWTTAFGKGWQRDLLYRAYSELYPDYRKAWGLHNEAEFQSVLWSAFGRGTDLGSDWAQTKGGIAIPRHPGLVVPYHRDLGGVVHPMQGFLSSVFQTAADWAKDPFMAMMAYQSMAGDKQQRQSGGGAGKGLYIVGEIGPELFVPKRLSHLIPKKVMDQIPKAADGMQVIGKKRNELFAPPEDGIIVPNRLMDQIPHAARGSREARATIRGRPAETDMDAAYEEMYRVDAEAAFDASGRRLPRRETQPPVATPPAPATPTPARTARPKRPVDIPGTAEWSQEMARRALYLGGEEGDRQSLLQSLGVRSAEPGYGHLLPARTPRGAIAAIGSFLGVGAEQARKQKEYAAAQAALNKAVDIAKPDLEAYNKTLLEYDRQLAKNDITQEVYTKNVDALNKQYAGALEAPRKAVERFNKAAEDVIPSAGNVVKNLGIIIGATSAYGLAMQAANAVIQPAIEGTIKAVHKQADAWSGWGSTFTSVTTALAKQTAQANGNVEAVMAQTAVTAGLSGSMLDYVKGATQASVVAKAGAMAQEETAQMQRSALGAGRAPSGLIGGYGGVLGTSFLASELGGGKGFMETVAGQFAGNRSAVKGPNWLGDVEQGLRFVGNTDYRNMILGFAKETGNPLGEIGDILGNLGNEYRSQGVNAATAMNPIAWLSMAMGGPTAETAATQGAATMTAGEQYATTAGMTPEQIKADVQSMEDLNAAAERGASVLGNTTKVTWEYATSKEEEDRFVRQAILAGDEYGAMMARTSHIVIKTNGELATASNILAAEQQTATGKTMASAEAWAGLQTRQIRAQLQMAAAQGQRQRELQIPYGIYQQTLQQPLLPPGLGLIPGAGAGTPNIGGTGASKAVQGLISGWVSQQQSAQEQINDIAATGLAKMRDDIGGSLGAGALADFDKWNVAAQNASTAIAEIQKKVGDLQAAASSLEWSNSIRIAKRSLGDALGMAGLGTTKTAAGTVMATNLGKMERASHFLEVSATRLSLALQERQITTQRALAGFQAPGETGEERYMRQKQALAEAAISERKLTISEKEFGLSQKIWIENANRAALDAQKAIEVMQASRNASAATAEAEQDIAAQSKLLAAHMSNMDTLVQQAQSNWQTVTSAALSGISQFAGGLDTGVKAIYKALGYTMSTGRQGQTIFTAGTGPSAGMPTVVLPSVGLPDKKDNRAAGFLGNVSMATPMIVGEAGTETVAILRNPRMASLGGGGGSSPTNVNININGPVVRGEQDISALAQAVAAEVERTLSRKGQMLGLRAPAY